MIKETLTWQDNKTITYPSTNGTSRYEDDWHLISLTLEDYHASAFHSAFEVEFNLDGLPGEDWKPVTDEGVKTYLGLRLSKVKHQDKLITYVIRGKGRLSHHDSIVVAGVKGGPREDKMPSDFRSSYSEIEISIVGRDKDERGFLRFSAANDHFGESLSFDAQMPNEKLKELVHLIAQSPNPPILTLGMHVMLFAPSWYGLAPSDSFTQFLYPADLGFRIAMVSTLGVAIERGATVDLITNEPVERDEPVEVTQTSDPVATKLVNQINMALWALVGIVGAFAISRWL